MGPWHDRIIAIAAALMMIACVLLCHATIMEARACEADPVCLMRVRDVPVVTYPATRDYALHGTPVALTFGGETHIIEPTHDELLYGMRYSREP